MENKTTRRRPVPTQSLDKRWRHKIIDVEVPLDSNGKPKHIFVYLRRSTSNKQELSLQRQEDSALDTILGNGYKESDVEYYIESKTAYWWVRVTANGVIQRRRTEFTRMLRDIDNSPVPVTILAYEDSRLSRNDMDSQEILARLFGEYEAEKKNIEKIVFNGGETWTDKSNKGDIKQRLLDRYKESLKTGERSAKATLRELRKGRYILSTPVGIIRLKKGEDELRVDANIPHIIRAWEMQAEGKNKKTITGYLNKWGITITGTFEKYFRNTIYAGFHIDPENGKKLPMMFKWGKAPIDRDLWEWVQKTLWVRRKSKYWGKQDDDTIASLLRWEHEEIKLSEFTIDHKKWWRYYKSNAHGGYNKSQLIIIRKFIETAIPKLMRLYCDIQQWTEAQIKDEFYEKNNSIIHSEDGIYSIRELENKIASFTPDEKKRLQEIDIQENELQAKMFLIEIWEDISTLRGQDSTEQVKQAYELYAYSLSSSNAEEKKIYALNKRKRIYTKCKTEYRKLEKEKDMIISLYGNEIIDFWEKEYQLWAIVEEKISAYIRAIFKESSMLENDETEAIDKEEYKKRLISSKTRKEEEKKNILKNALKQVDMDDETQAIAKELREDVQKEIDSIELKIAELSENTDIGEFLTLLPEVLWRTFELCGKAISNAKFEDIKDDIDKLMKLVTFELSVSTKKELTVKLFEGLEDVLKLKNKEWLPKLDSNQWPTG
jgi:hypothetical protein